MVGDFSEFCSHILRFTSSFARRRLQNPQYTKRHPKARIYSLQYFQNNPFDNIIWDASVRVLKNLNEFTHLL